MLTLFLFISQLLFSLLLVYQRLDGFRRRRDEMPHEICNGKPFLYGKCTDKVQGLLSTIYEYTTF